MFAPDDGQFLRDLVGLLTGLSIVEGARHRAITGS
jgi:hypothetical protein